VVQELILLVLETHQQVEQAWLLMVEILFFYLTPQMEVVGLLKRVQQDLRMLLVMLKMGVQEEGQQQDTIQQETPLPHLRLKVMVVVLVAMQVILIILMAVVVDILQQVEIFSLTELVNHSLAHQVQKEVLEHSIQPQDLITQVAEVVAVFLVL
jgi:hypothetical protein